MARRILLIVGVVVVALLVAADFGARIVAEHMVATAAADSLHTSQRPDVSLGGWPFLPRFFAGHLPSATIRATGLTEGGVTLVSGALTLDDLRFSPSDVIRGRGTVSADTGDGSATLTEQQATAALRRSGEPVTVRFDLGSILLTSTQLHLTVRATASIQGDELVLRSSEGALAALAIRLPSITHGVRYTGVRIGNGTAALQFQVTGARFRVGS